MKATKQKKGDKVSLQPQLLANLKELIMLEFSTMERASIATYELQNFLIEICVYPKDHYEGMKFDQFFNWLVTSIRCEPKLWIKSSPMYEEICSFLKNSQAKLLELKKQAQEDDKQNQHQFYIPEVDNKQQDILNQNKIGITNYQRQMGQIREMYQD